MSLNIYDHKKNVEKNPLYQVTLQQPQPLFTIFPFQNYTVKTTRSEFHNSILKKWSDTFRSQTHSGNKYKQTLDIDRSIPFEDNCNWGGGENSSETSGICFHASNIWFITSRTNFTYTQTRHKLNSLLNNVPEHTISRNHHHNCYHICSQFQ